MRINKTTIFFPILLAALVLSFSSPAIFADPPWKNGSGHGKFKGKKHKQKWHNEQKGGGPPPWAPAHGYRRKHEHGHEHAYHDHDYHDDQASVQVTVQPTYEEVTEEVGISSGTCNRKAVGTLLGGVIGGVIGNKIGKKNGNRDLTTVAGVLLGGVIGRRIGDRMDKVDVQCTGQALERAEDGNWVEWDNRETGVNYRVTPYETYQSDGRYCRKYLTEVKDGSGVNKQRATACRNEDGTWQQLRSNS